MRVTVLPFTRADKWITLDIMGVEVRVDYDDVDPDDAHRVVCAIRTALGLFNWNGDEECDEIGPLS